MHQPVGPGPVFIGGAPRSGTTLLRAIVNATGVITCGPELRVVPALCQLAGQVETYHANVLNAEYDLSREALQASFARSIAGFLEPVANRTGLRPAEKTPANILHFPTLRALFPDSPLIAIVRDPRDVVASLLGMGWRDGKTGEPMEITRNAASAAQLWLSSVKTGTAMRDDPGYLEVRYESLAQDPASETGRLADHLGLNELARERALSHWRFYNAESGEAESSAARAARPVDTSAIGRWRSVLTPQQRSEVEQITGEMMDTLGYV